MMRTYPEYLGKEDLSFSKVVGLQDSLGTLMEMKGFRENNNDWSNKNPRCVSVWDNRISLFRKFTKHSSLTKQEMLCKYKWDFDFGSLDYDKVIKCALNAKGEKDE